MWCRVNQTGVVGGGGGGGEDRGGEEEKIMTQGITPVL